MSAIQPLLVLVRGSCNFCFPSNPTPFLLPSACFVPPSHSASHQVHKSLAAGIIFLFLQHLSFIIPHLSKGLEALPSVNTNSTDVYFLLPLQFSFSSVTFFFFFLIFLSNLLNFIYFFSCSMFSSKKICIFFQIKSVFCITNCNYFM